MIFIIIEIASLEITNDFFSVNPWPGINFLGSFCANSCAMKIVFISNSNYYFYVHSLSAGHAWFYSQTAESAVRAKKNRNTLRVHCTWLIWTSSRGGTGFLPLFISITYFILTALFHSWLATKGGPHSPCSWMPGCRYAGMPGCRDARMPMPWLHASYVSLWGADDWVLGIETNSNMALAEWQNLPRHIYIK